MNKSDVIKLEKEIFTEFLEFIGRFDKEKSEKTKKFDKELFLRDARKMRNSWEKKEKNNATSDSRRE
jgi:hypothetical protein